MKTEVISAEWLSSNVSQKMHCFVQTWSGAENSSIPARSVQARILHGLSLAKLKRIRNAKRPGKLHAVALYYLERNGSL